jgi:hypothetical protein
MLSENSARRRNKGLPAKDTHGNDTSHPAFPKKFVVFVHCIANAPAHNRHAETLRSDCNSKKSPSRQPERGRKQKRSITRMPTARGLKARFLWVYVRSTNAEPASLVWRKPISNIFWSLVRLILHVWPIGSEDINVPSQARATAFTRLFQTGIA